MERQCPFEKSTDWPEMLHGQEAQPPSQASTKTKFGFVIVIIFLIFEYARPQDKIGAIGALRPALVLSLLAVLSWFKCKNANVLRNAQFLHILLLTVLMGVLTPLAANNFRAFIALEGFMLLFPLSISIVLFVNNFARLRTFLNWWCFLAMYVAINGILNRGVAGSSFLGDENDVSLLMNVMQPFSLCLFFYERKILVKLLYLAASLTCVSCVVASGSRGGFVGLVVGLAVIWLGSPRKILSLVLVSILAAGVLAAADQKYWDRIATIEKTGEGTAKERIDSWDAGWEMFKDNPLGVGQGNFPIRFPEYQPADMSRNMYGRQAHSLWFTLLPELGLAGTLLYLSMTLFNLRDLNYLRTLPQKDEDARLLHFISLAFMASMAGFFTSGTFISVLFYPHYWYLTAMIVACRQIAITKMAFIENAEKRSWRNMPDLKMPQSRGQ